MATKPRPNTEPQDAPGALETIMLGSTPSTAPPCSGRRRRPESSGRVDAVDPRVDTVDRDGMLGSTPATRGMGAGRRR